MSAASASFADIYCLTFLWLCSRIFLLPVGVHRRDPARGSVQLEVRRRREDLRRFSEALLYVSRPHHFEPAGK